MTWQESIEIPRSQLRGVESLETSDLVRSAMSDRYRGAASFTQRLLLMDYPNLTDDLSSVFSWYSPEDAARLQANAQFLPTGFSSPDLTEIPQQIGIPHSIKKATLKPQEFIIMNNSPDEMEELGYVHIPEKKYIAPFIIVVQYDMDITEFYPNSMQVHKAYPLHATVESAFTPTISAQKHARWNRPQLFPGMISDSTIFWDQESADKLYELHIQMTASRYMHYAVTSTSARYQIQAGGMSGNG